jgi:exopolysaccharide biosynthesis polyprenyl glycosylphosphotransferase
MLKIFNFYISQWKIVLFVGDVLIYFISWGISLIIYPHTSANFIEYLLDNKLIFIVIGVIYFIVLFIADNYNYFKDFRKIVNIVHVLISCWVGALVVVICYYFPSKGAFVSRTLLAIQATCFVVMITSWRFAFSAIALPQRLEKRILIIGAGKSGRYLLNSIRIRPGCGLLVVGFVDDDENKVGETIEGLKVLGDSSKLPELVNEYQINLAVMAITKEKQPKLINNLILLSWNDCQLIDMPTVYEALTAKLPTEHISDNWIFEWNINTTKIYYRRLKRLIDIILASVFLVLTSPIMLLTAIVIKLDSEGPIFFLQERLGQKEKSFKIIKFRTMVQDAVNYGPLWTTKNDPRITRVGRIIRKLRFDEFPQLINILRGEMSFIGPRPLAHCSSMADIRYYKYRLLVKPGITGWAQVMYPHGIEAETTPEKLKYDLYYIKNLGFLLDMAILLKTIRIVVFGRGL